MRLADIFKDKSIKKIDARAMIMDAILHGDFSGIMRDFAGRIGILELYSLSAREKAGLPLIPTMS